jgi:hypothetical protein
VTGGGVGTTAVSVICAAEIWQFQRSAGAPMSPVIPTCTTPLVGVTDPENCGVIVNSTGCEVEPRKLALPMNSALTRCVPITTRSRSIGKSTSTWPATQRGVDESGEA